jgi:hypothetical protein
MHLNLKSTLSSFWALQKQCKLHLFTTICHAETQEYKNILIWRIRNGVSNPIPFHLYDIAKL